MSKLLKLKEWLTVEDAAKRLSISAGEEVSEADVLRLALEGHLTLSVYFVNHARGRPVRIEPFDEESAVKVAEEFAKSVPKPLHELDVNVLGQLLTTMRGELLPDGKRQIFFEGDMQKPDRLDGVWDLMMLGAEKLDVEHAYQNLTGGPGVELICLGGPLVASEDQGKIFQVLENYTRETRPNRPVPSQKPKISKETRESLDLLNEILGQVEAIHQNEEDPPSWDYETVYYPAGGLPEDSIFVVRTSALRALEEKLLIEEAQSERPLHPSERRSVGQIIATLAAMARLDLSAPYAADETLRAAAASHGLEMPSSPETVVKFLKDAVARTGKA